MPGPRVDVSPLVAVDSPAWNAIPVVLGETCDVCNAIALVERRCKVICLNCHSIVRSCADL